MPPVYPAGSYPALVVADGASAFWRLNETSGTTAVDVIAGANGTISGGVTLGQAGALADGNKAMAFNAAGKITVAKAAYSDFGTGSLTFEYWLQFPGSPSNFPYVCQNRGDPGPVGFDSYLGTGRTLFLRVWNATPLASISVADLSESQWHYVVGVVRRGAPDTLELYIDTVLRGSQALSTSGLSLTNPGSCFVGGSSHPSAEFWPGLLDDVAIYPTALTPQQIAAHYTARLVGLYPEGSYPDKVIRDSPSAYWRLGETSGTTAVDVIAGANGTISGGVTLGQTGALADGDKGMRFNGTSGKVSIPVGSYSAIGTGPMTVELWFWTDDAASTRYICDNKQHGTVAVAGFNIFYNTANLYFRVGNGTAMKELLAPKPLAGRWYAVTAVVRRGATDMLELYLDGVKSVETALAATGWNLTASKPFELAAPVEFAANYLVGLLDDVAIYPTALTPQQIADHYEARLFSGTGSRGVPWWITNNLERDGYMQAFNIWRAVTPSDTVDLPRVSHAIWVGGAGDLAVVREDNQAVTLVAVPAGSWLPLMVRRVNAAGTSATNVVALYQA